jgi:plastocyanin
MDRMRTGTSFAVALALVTLAAGAFGSALAAAARQTAQTDAKPVAIRIDNFTFAPQTITVPVGTTVVWTNGDDIPHTVLNTDKAFKSKALDTGDTFTFQFTKAGKYPYYCSIHPEMTGEIDVK